MINIMRKNVAILLTTIGLVGALPAGLTIARAQTPPAASNEVPKHKRTERHPAIHRAIMALEDAKRDLQHANHDFGGHRKAALEECDKAIAELRLALQYDKK